MKKNHCICSLLSILSTLFHSWLPATTALRSRRMPMSTPVPGSQLTHTKKTADLVTETKLLPFFWCSRWSKTGVWRMSHVPEQEVKDRWGPLHLHGWSGWEDNYGDAFPPQNKNTKVRTEVGLYSFLPKGTVSTWLFSR